MVRTLLLSLCLVLAQQSPTVVAAALPAPAPVQVKEVQPERSDKQMVYDTLKEMGRGGEYWCLHNIFMKESSWNPEARGDNGDSYGLPQRHAPAHGVPPQPWLLADQVAWAVTYADARYGSICLAWEAWQRKGWW